MQTATRGIFFFIGFILFMYGVIDIVEQLKDGGEIKWGIPIIFLGFGVGIPSVLFSFPDMFNSESDGCSSGESDDYSSGDCGGD